MLVLPEILSDSIICFTRDLKKKKYEKTPHDLHVNTVGFSKDDRSWLKKVLRVCEHKLCCVLSHCFCLLGYKQGWCQRRCFLSSLPFLSLRELACAVLKKIKICF